MRTHTVCRPPFFWFKQFFGRITQPGPAPKALLQQHQTRWQRRCVLSQAAKQMLSSVQSRPRALPTLKNRLPPTQKRAKPRLETNKSIKQLSLLNLKSLLVLRYPRALAHCGRSAGTPVCACASGQASSRPLLDQFNTVVYSKEESSVVTGYNTMAAGVLS